MFNLVIILFWIVTKSSPTLVESNLGFMGGFKELPIEET